MFHFSILWDWWFPRDQECWCWQKNTYRIWNALCWKNSFCLKKNTIPNQGQMSRRRPRTHLVIFPVVPPWQKSPRCLLREGQWAYVHEGSIDIVAALPVDGDEERQTAVWGQDVHAAVFLVVPGQERNATVFHTQRRRYHVQGLCDRAQARGEGNAG